jgi:hypothetical protein
MKRFSVPVDNELFHEFETKVPHGIKSTLIRGLVRVAMQAPSHIMWDIASNETKPELFEIKERTSETQKA